MSITVIRSTLDFMTKLFFWPEKTKELNSSNWFYVKFVLAMLSTWINLIGCILHLIFVSYPQNSFFHIAEDLVTISTQIGVYYYVAAFVPSQKIAARLYLKLSSFEPYGEPPAYVKHTRILYYLGYVYTSNVNVVIVAFFFEPILSKKYCERKNAAENFNDICGLVNSAWMPFDITSFPNKQLLMLWQTWGLFWIYRCGASVSYSQVSSLEHILMKIWHLNDLFKEAIQTEDQQLNKELLSKCVKYHNYILKLAEDADNVYMRCMFVHVIFSGVVIGIMGFSFITVGVSIKIVTLSTLWISGTIFSSVAAQRLYDGSLTVTEAVYFSEWYNRNYKLQKDLAFIMQRTQRPIRLHAGPFAELSILFVLTIFKSAYSYLTLLTATNQKRA